MNSLNRVILFALTLLVLNSSIYAIGNTDDQIPKIEAISNEISELGEGPHWDIETQSLYYVDIHSAIVFRYDYKTNEIYKTEIKNETYAGFIIPIESQPNHFAVGLSCRVGILQWDGISKDNKISEILFEIDEENCFGKNRFNDAKADPRGRFFGGTMTTNLNKISEIFSIDRTGTFYRRQKNETPVKLFSNLGISNGLSWNTVTNKFYYIDSLALNIKEYDYDINSGEISKPRVVIDFRNNGTYPGFIPDGMTIDRNGFLFVALFIGSKVLKINPVNGYIVQEINMPCEQITSVAFGGPNLDILYVTSGSLDNAPPPAGKTFKITGLETNGLRFKVFRNFDA